MTRRQLIFNVFISILAIILGVFTIKKYFIKKVSLDTLNNFKYLISDIAEVIIPVTDTPGAKDAKVVNYIINVITNCANDRDKDRFIYGLESVEHYCLKNFSKSFVDCTNNEKIIVLGYFEKKYKYS